MTKKPQTLSLREGGKHDYSKNLGAQFTGWGAVCKARTGDNSRSQRRKRNRKGQ